MGKAISIIVIAVILGIAIFFFARQSNAPSLTESPIMTYSAMPSASVSVIASASAGPISAKTYTITYTSQGKLDTSNITIKLGDTVKFVNKDSNLHWPASDPHPIHTICPGFDALRGLAKGESYSFTFNVAKICPFHDHLNPRTPELHGQVVVTP